MSSPTKTSHDLIGRICTYDNGIINVEVVVLRETAHAFITDVLTRFDAVVISGPHKGQPMLRLSLPYLNPTNGIECVRCGDPIHTVSVFPDVVYEGADGSYCCTGYHGHDAFGVYAPTHTPVHDDDTVVWDYDDACRPNEDGEWVTEPPLADETLSAKCARIYADNGQSAVLDYVSASHPHLAWCYCGPCETASPKDPTDGSCLVCGHL